MTSLTQIPRIRQLVRRDLLRRFRGSLLGLGWTLLRPLLLLTGFHFAFRVVLDTQWPGAAGEGEVALRVFLGVLIFQFFAEILTRGPSLLLENRELVTKIAFPRELLGVAATLTAAVPLGIGVGVVLVAARLGGLPAPASPLLLLGLGLACCLSACGLSLLLAATGAYLRDLRPGMQLATQLLMFLSPVFYPVSLVPPPLRPWVRVNPVAAAIEVGRSALLGGPPPPLALLVGGSLGSLALLGLGLAWFRRLEPGFRDVL